MLILPHQHQLSDFDDWPEVFSTVEHHSLTAASASSSSEGFE